MKKLSSMLLINLLVAGVAAAQEPLYSKTFQLSDLTIQGQQYQLTVNPDVLLNNSQPLVLRVQAKVSGEGTYSSTTQAECSYSQQSSCQGQTRPVSKHLYQFELNALVTCGSREVLDKTLFDGEYTDMALTSARSAIQLDEATVVLAPAECQQLKLLFTPLQLKTLQNLDGRIEILSHSSQPGLTLSEVR